MNSFDLATGTFRWKAEDEASDLLEGTALHNYQYGTARGMNMYEVEAVSMNEVGTTSMSCEMCGGGHQAIECPILMSNAMIEQPTINHHPMSNQYSNTYDPSWQDHINFDWPNQSQPYQDFNQNFYPPNIQQEALFPPQNQNQFFLPQQQEKSNLEVMLEDFIVSQTEVNEQFKQFQQQISSKIGQLETQTMMLENQVAQQIFWTKIQDTSSEEKQAPSSQKDYSDLPSQSETNPREEIQMIALQSERQDESQMMEEMQKPDPRSEEKQDLSSQDKQDSEAEKEPVGSNDEENAIRGQESKEEHHDVEKLEKEPEMQREEELEENLPKQKEEAPNLKLLSHSKIIFFGKDAYHDILVVYLTDLGKAQLMDVLPKPRKGVG